MSSMWSIERAMTQRDRPMGTARPGGFYSDRFAGTAMSQNTSLIRLTSAFLLEYEKRRTLQSITTRSDGHQSVSSSMAWLVLLDSLL